MLMQRICTTIAIGALGAALLSGGVAAAADAPVLIVLQYQDGGNRILTKVEAKAGQTLAPTRGKTFERVGILPGNTFATTQRPGDVTVDLYRGANVERSLLCSIAIRYFRDSRGQWVPHFQLMEDPIVIRGPDGRWQPINMARGAPSLIVLTSSTLPNADGFYPALEFGLTNGLVQIDSWVVR